MVQLGDRQLRAERVFCVGRNYTEHARELGNEPPPAPVIFMKPATSILAPGRAIRAPEHGDDLHYEAELVLLLDPVGQGGWDDVAGIAVGLDLTLRDVQRDLKSRGLPWELAKAFDGSAPLGPFTRLGEIGDREGVEFRCRINGQERQHGRIADMIFAVPRLIAALSRAWTLRTGDLVYTGTPAGVGPLRSGDRVELSGTGLVSCSWSVA